MNRHQLINRLTKVGYYHQFKRTKDPRWEWCFVKNGSGVTVVRISLHNGIADSVKYYSGSVLNQKLVDALTYKEPFSEYCKMSCRGFLTMSEFNELRSTTMLEF